MITEKRAIRSCRKVT